MSPDIEIFDKKINSITEHNDGNFASSINACINQLRKDLPPLEDENINKKLEDMQEFLRQQSDMDFFLVRERLLQDAQYIDELLAAHKQDWESIV